MSCCNDKSRLASLKSNEEPNVARDARTSRTYGFGGWCYAFGVEVDGKLAMRAFAEEILPPSDEQSVLFLSVSFLVDVAEAVGFQHFAMYVHAVDFLKQPTSQP